MSRSLQSRLFLGLLGPVVGIMALSATLQYRQALEAADIAYDRTLLSSAQAVGEQLELDGAGEQIRVLARLPSSALEPFEVDLRSTLYYRILGFQREHVAGYTDLPPIQPAPTAGPTPYAALVHFYDDVYRGEPIRVSVLQQPVAGPQGQGMAVVQVAETLELRRALAQQLLVHTLGLQALLIGAIAGLLWWLVRRTTVEIKGVGQGWQARSANDLSPLDTDLLPRELRPMADAANVLMDRMAGLMARQRRFIRDAAHQLRTPLAVLRVQVQAGLKGHVPAEQSLSDMAITVDSATRLAQQMLSLARVEQWRQSSAGVTASSTPAATANPPQRLMNVVQALALEMAPLWVDKQVECDIQLDDVGTLHAPEWALRELVRNLLHNAIKASPTSGTLTMILKQAAGPQTASAEPLIGAELLIADEGSGLDDKAPEWLFQPFAHRPQAGQEGTGLGLAICHDIVQTLGGEIRLTNRTLNGRTVGLDARIWLPLDDPAPASTILHPTSRAPVTAPDNLAP
jgi:two-component system, OmpR family, sensor histidine kinase TctE